MLAQPQNRRVKATEGSSFTHEDPDLVGARPHLFPHCGFSLQIRHETQAPESTIHQCPDPIVPGAVTYRSCSAFQRSSRSQADPHLGCSSVPGSLAQRSPEDPLAAASLKRRFQTHQSRPLLLLLLFI